MRVCIKTFIPEGPVVARRAAFMGLAVLLAAGGTVLGRTFRQAPAAGSAAPSGPVTAPRVTGPVANTTAMKDPAHGYPFSATPMDLKKAGYVEEEFFIEGLGNRYTNPAGGGRGAPPPAQNATIQDGGHPFKTRIVVRRPASQSKFNGTVIVEWTNVSQGHDNEVDWFQTQDHLVRAGYAWVGVSAQSVGVRALKEWSPARYGTLNVDVAPAPEAAAAPAAAAGQGAAPAGRGGRGGPGGGGGGDIANDVFTAAALAVRGKSSVNVMGGLRIERVIATGHSQSAGRLGTYFNFVHPLTPVFDAVVLHGGGGTMRTDLNVKIFKLVSETDLGEVTGAQPDSDKYRIWEVAGASHLDAQASLGLGNVGLLVAGATPILGKQMVAGPTISGGGAGIGTYQTLSTAANDGCARPPMTRVPFHYVMAAAYDSLAAWLKSGKAPPIAPRFEMEGNAPKRDANGNALGAIQLAEHAVPIGVNRGDNAASGQGNVACNLLGSYEPFDAAKLASLYPTHADYVNKVKAAADKVVKAGFVLKADAAATVEAAERSNVGKK